MWCNHCCRWGGTEMIENLGHGTCTIHDVLTNCNLNVASDIHLQKLIDHIQQLQPRIIKKSDITELSVILTSKSPRLLWSVVFNCIANQPSTVVDLDDTVIETIWSNGVYGSVRYRWLILRSCARETQGKPILSEEWNTIFSALVDTTDWTAFAIEHTADFLALPFGTRSTTILRHPCVSDRYVIHVEVHHVIPCLSVIRRHHPISAWQCLYRMLQYCDVGMSVNPIGDKHVPKFVTICNGLVATGFAEDTELVLIFQCAVNALYVLTSGTIVPGVTNDIAKFIQTYKFTPFLVGELYYGRHLRFS